MPTRFARSAVVLLTAALPAVVAACGRGETRPAAGGARVRDDFGDTLALSGPAPRRIVSLNPATTAMLFAMGAGGRVVGRTRWDSYPPAALAVASVGDGLRPNVEAVLAVRPDLVVLYASADDRDAARRLHAAGVATLSIRNDHMADFRRAMILLGRATHDSARSAAVADSVEATVARVRAALATQRPVRLAWIVDASPLRAIGGGSYLSDLVRDAGGENVYAHDPDAAPEVSLEDVLRRDPEAVLTTPVAARTLRGDPRWQSWLAAPGHRVLVPDSALVGTPSVRMGEAAIDLATLLHPGALR